jgi:hypothetical protein
MEPEDRKLIEKGLTLTEIYLKGRTISKISFAIITAGLSILGFNNFLPFLAVTVRPELVNKIDLNNSIFTIVGVFLIGIGSLIPVFIKIFNYYKKLYTIDLEKTNKIYALYDFETFTNDMLHIANNMTMFDFQVERIEELYLTILGNDFYFNDKAANDSLKRFGNELNSFNHTMSFRLSPSNGNPHLYNIPRNIYTPQQITTLNNEMANDCNRLTASYTALKAELDRLNYRKFYRFFS